MPEGHSVHRIALQFKRDFVGHRVSASSPQGRFAAGAEDLDGRAIVASTAVGKHLLLEFEGERTLHVHLGLYGSWDFAGEVTAAPTFTVEDGRVGDEVRRTGSLGAVAGYREGALSQATPEQLAAAQDAAGERNLRVGGPGRRTTLRMSESDSEVTAPAGDFPPPPIGAVRVRLLTETAVADLRGPTACEVFDPQQVEKLLAKLGPDPMHDASRKAENRFVQRVLKSSTPIGLQLMDQSVVAGIGNIYRAELLFRARLNPHAPGKTVPEAALRRLWKDWAHLLAIGVETGQMLTRADLKTEQDYRRALRSKDQRHYVYKRTGQKSLRGSGTVVMEDMGGRTLYWAPGWQTRPEA